MSEELKKVISEIKFPVRYDAAYMSIVGNNGWSICHLDLHYLTGESKEKIQDAFGEELARLINTLDPAGLTLDTQSISDNSFAMEGYKHVKNPEEWLRNGFKPKTEQ